MKSFWRRTVSNSVDHLVFVFAGSVVAEGMVKKWEVCLVGAMHVEQQ